MDTARNTPYTKAKSKRKTTIFSKTSIIKENPTKLTESTYQTFEDNLDKIKTVLPNYVEGKSHYIFLDILDPWSGTWNTLDLENSTIFDQVYFKLGNETFNKTCLIGLYSC